MVWQWLLLSTKGWVLLSVSQNHRNRPFRGTCTLIKLCILERFYSQFFTWYLVYFSIAGYKNWVMSLTYYSFLGLGIIMPLCRIPVLPNLSIGDCSRRKCWSNYCVIWSRAILMEWSIKNRRNQISQAMWSMLTLS